MKLHKHFPPYLSQSAFLNIDGYIENINSLDYDLFLWLIYNTHKKYRDDKSLTYEFEYSEIKKSFSKQLNTQKIKESLQKLGKIQILSNLLKSYEDKEEIFIKPFEIEIITTDKNISYGFEVTTTNDFMESFNNPIPKVDVNYNIIYNLKPTMSKLLYLFLRDSNGKYKNTKRYRNVDIQRLRYMMNVVNEDTTNSNFITQLKKCIKNINEYSDIDVGFTVDKKRNLRSGISEIKNIKFTIELNTDKIYKTNTKKSQTHQQLTQKTTDTVSENYFEKYLQQRINEEYDKSLSNGVDIKNPTSYKNGIKNKLIDDGIENQFELLQILETQKNRFRDSLPSNQPYQIILKDKDNPYNNCYINNDFKWVTIFDNEIVTKTIDESIEFIETNENILEFDILKCDYSDKFKVGRI